MNRMLDDIMSIVCNRDLFDSLNHSKILITGASGLIGSMLAKTLVEARKAYDLDLTILGQIRNAEKAKDVFGGYSDSLDFVFTDDVPCDYVIHTVSPTASKYFIEHPAETIKTSVGTAMSMLETARKNKATVVYLSSMEQYGVPSEKGMIMTEDRIGTIDHLNIRSSYSESKRLCECLCVAYAAEYGVNVKIARLAQTFGAGIPLSDSRMPMQFARSVIYKRDIILHTPGKSVCNFVYLSDAIHAILLLLQKGEAGQAYNVCNDKETRTVLDIAKLVAADVAKGKISVLIELIENMGYAPDNTMRLNSDKLYSLGWKPDVGMKEAYIRLVDYLSEKAL